MNKVVGQINKQSNSLRKHPIDNRKISNVLNISFALPVGRSNSHQLTYFEAIIPPNIVHNDSTKGRGFAGYSGG